jgi:hypothetical protein
MSRLAFLLAAMAVVAALWPAFGQAQQGIDISSQEVRNNFPEGAVFKLDFEGEEPIKEVRFRYAIAPDGAQAYGVPECTGVTVVQCTFELESTVTNFLIPGVEITYFWQIKDHAGRTVETEPGRYMYEDDRFQWRSLSSAGGGFASGEEDGLTVWFYAGSESGVRDLLGVGRETLKRMGALLGTEVDFPVKVFLYDSAADMEPVILARQLSPQAGIIALGEVVVSDTAIVARDAYPLDVLRHELSHIVLRRAVRGPFRNLPAWIEEGVAVYGQTRPMPDMEGALKAAIDSNRPFSVRSLSSASVGQSEGNVSLFYGQSYSLVRFLIDEYGEGKFRDLLAAFREGNRTDDALTQVYGFDQDGLENAWRRSVGLPERVIEEGQGPSSRPLPQITPFGADQVQQQPQEPESGGAPAPAAAEEDKDVPVVALTVVVLVTLAMAGIFAAAAVLVLRRR